MSQVSLAACDAYSHEEVAAAIEKSMSALGGLSAFCQRGDKVLLKVNLVSNKPPETAATTHPMVAQVLAEMLVAMGCQVWIGDSPGGLFNPETLKRTYKGTGMTEAAQNSGATLSYETGEVEVDNPDGVVLRKVSQSTMLQGMDKVISVCKLKTHGMMLYTGAVKNQYGTVPGTKKVEYHFRTPSEDDFANTVIDINLAAHPDLYVMDAVMAMEGNGPTGGSPRKMGLIIAGADPFALDMVASHLIHIERDEIAILRQGYRRGLCPERLADIEILGENVDDFRIMDFKRPDHLDSQIVRGPVGRLLASWLRPKVRFNKDVCIGCGCCVRDCPAHAMKLVNHLPKVNYSQCIRCYCCQELCLKNAVTIHESPLMKIANKL